MTAHRRYVAVEATISAVINALLSVAFVFLLFGGQDGVTVPALVLDALPQSFMIALMAALVPTLLTRRRLRAGRIAGEPRPGNVLVASLLTALVVAAVAWAVQWAVLPLLLPGAVPFGVAAAGKAIYGAALGAVVTTWTLRRELVG